MLKKYAQPLKLISLGLGVVGYFIAKELESRELEETVNKAVDTREREVIRQEVTSQLDFRERLIN